MTLNTILFTPQLITELYKRSLIEINKKEFTTTENTEQVNWKFLGENRKNILILVNNPDVVFLPDAQLDFLTKLLSACNLNLGDVAVLNFNTHPTLNSKDLITHFNSKTIFLFGVEPGSIGMPILFPHFQIQNFNNCTYLFTPSLSELENDKLLKSKFWVCLKKIFNL